MEAESILWFFQIWDFEMPLYVEPGLDHFNMLQPLPFSEKPLNFSRHVTDFQASHLSNTAKHKKLTSEESSSKDLGVKLYIGWIWMNLFCFRHTLGKTPLNLCSRMVLDPKVDLLFAGCYPPKLGPVDSGLGSWWKSYDINNHHPPSTNINHHQPSATAINHDRPHLGFLTADRLAKRRSWWNWVSSVLPWKRMEACLLCFAKPGMLPGHKTVVVMFVFVFVFVFVLYLHLYYYCYY